MDSATEQRSTCAGSQRLFDALAQVVRGRGRSFVMYDEAERVEKAKTLPEAIGKAHDILVALRAMSCNLFFYAGSLAGLHFESLQCEQRLRGLACERS